MNKSNFINTNTVWQALLNVKRGISSEAISFKPDGTCKISGKLTSNAQEILDLYSHFITRNQPVVTAHLGQSMDGFIATTNGKSHYINCHENIVHLHRMRALADAVLVGSNTVHNDNPQLTTRLVDGPNPVRVVIDPTLRLSPNHHIFAQSEAPTLVICGKGARNENLTFSRHVEILRLPISKEKVSPRDCCQTLASRGLYNLLIEGGGTTVSQFVNAGTVHYLQIALAPIFLGEGKRGFHAPEALEPSAGLRFNMQKYPMGNDILYHCRLTSSPSE